MSNKANNPSLAKPFLYILAGFLVLALNVAVFGFFGPALISAASTIALLGGISLCFVTFLFDLFVAVSVIRSLYNINSTEEEIS